jgi:hypothetical protein
MSGRSHCLDSTDSQPAGREADLEQDARLFIPILSTGPATPEPDVEGRDWRWWERQLYSREAGCFMRSCRRQTGSTVTITPLTRGPYYGI